MLARLDATARGARFVLRMEDIDPSSVTPAWRDGLLADLAWFGLAHDQLVWQSECVLAHAELMDILAESGRLYACSCSRSLIASAGLPSQAGGWVYPGTCRQRRLRDWRSCAEHVRIYLGDLSIELADEGDAPGTVGSLSQQIGRVMGDPLLRRKDGSFSYMLAVVADDHTAGVTRIVRGRDLASSSATQATLYQLAGWPVPSYRHHFLLLEPRGEKLAKFHGSVGVDKLQAGYSPQALRGILAFLAGFWDKPAQGAEWPDLSACFSWDKLRREDCVLGWNGTSLLY